MVISRDRFVQNGKEMFRNKKKHVKGVQGFCFRSFFMQNLWPCNCCRVVGLKLPFFFLELDDVAFLVDLARSYKWTSLFTINYWKSLAFQEFHCNTKVFQVDIINRFRNATGGQLQTFT